MSSNIKKNILDIYHNISNNRIFKIIRSISVFAVVTYGAFILSSVNISPKIAIVIVPAFLIGLFIFIRSFAHDKSTFKLLDVLFATINLFGYFFLRNIIGYENVSQYLYSFFSFNAEQFTTFNTFFIVGYGFTQLFIGYFLSKYSGRLLSVFGLITSGLLFSLSAVNGFSNPVIPFIMHGIIGILCSAYAVSLGTFIRNIKTTISGFGVLFSSIIIITCTIVNNISNYFTDTKMTNTEFQYMIYVISIPLGICAVYFAIHHFLLKKNDQITYTDISNETVSYTEVLRIIFTNKTYTSLAFQAIVFVIAGSLFRFGFIEKLCSKCPEAFTTDLAILKTEAKKFLELGFITGTVGIISMSSIFSDKNLMSLYSFVNMASIAAIAIHYFVSPLPFMAIQIALCGTFFANVGHNIPQIIAGSTEKNASVANTMVGIFNSLSMLAGTIIACKIMPDLLSLESSIIVLVALNALSLLISFAMPNKDTTVNSVKN